MKNQIAHEMVLVTRRFSDTLDARGHERLTQFETQRQDLVAQQRAERQALNDRIEQRQAAEREQRQMRFRTGFRGLWDRFSGKHSRIKSHNERERMRPLCGTEHRKSS
ncbi:MAG: hypothetical protein ABFS02_11265 [Pseudomonadota bacterium]